MAWFAFMLISIILALVLYEWGLPFLNKRLERERNWIDVVTYVLPTMMVIVSPLYGEYGYKSESVGSYQAVAFDDEGNVEDSSSTFVWCVTNNCANAPKEIKVAFDESTIKDGKIVRFVIEGEAVVTDYRLFFTIPGIVKPTGWWDTPHGYENAAVLSKVVEEHLCRLITYHTAELADVGFPLPRGPGSISAGGLVDKYVQPSLSQYGIEYTVTKFQLKDSCNCGQGEVPPRIKHGPSAY